MLSMSLSPSPHPSPPSSLWQSIWPMKPRHPFSLSVLANILTVCSPAGRNWGQGRNVVTEHPWGQLVWRPSHTNWPHFRKIRGRAAADLSGRSINLADLSSHIWRYVRNILPGKTKIFIFPRLRTTNLYPKDHLTMSKEPKSSRTGKVIIGF